MLAALRGLPASEDRCLLQRADIDGDARSQLQSTAACSHVAELRTVTIEWTMATVTIKNEMRRSGWPLQDHREQPGGPIFMLTAIAMAPSPRTSSFFGVAAGL